MTRGFIVGLSEQPGNKAQKSLKAQRPENETRSFDRAPVYLILRSPLANNLPHTTSGVYGQGHVPVSGRSARQTKMKDIDTTELASGRERNLVNVVARDNPACNENETRKTQDGRGTNSLVNIVTSILVKGKVRGVRTRARWRTDVTSTFTRNRETMLTSPFVPALSGGYLVTPAVKRVLTNPLSLTRRCA